MNAFLTVAATRHTQELQGNPRVEQIVQAAKAGHVPVHLVSSEFFALRETWVLMLKTVEDLSEKNPLQVLPYEATIVSLLELFSGGTHRGLLFFDSG